MSSIVVGDPIPAFTQLFDGADDKFPQAVVRNAAGTILGGGALDLALIADGMYGNSEVNMPNTPFVTVQYFVYSDEEHETLDLSYSQTMQTFTRAASGGGGGSTTVISNIIGVINGQGCKQTGIQDTLVKGSERALAIRLVEEFPNGAPFNLTLAENIVAKFLNEDRTVLELSLEDGDIEIEVAAAGQIRVNISDTASADLMPGSPMAFTMIVTMPDGPVSLNFPYQLAIVDESVGE